MVFGYLAERDTAGNPWPFALGESIDYLQGIENLLFLCAVEDWEASPDDHSLHSPWNFVRLVQVKRISYASPFEVAVTFFAGTGVATLTASRLIKLWTNFQFARRATSEADMAKSEARRAKSETDLRVAASGILQATIDAPIPIQPNTVGYDRFLLATRVLSSLSSIEVKEEA